MECNGGHIALTKHWAKYLMERMGFVKHQASTKVSVSDINSLKAKFIFVVIQIEEIPSDLVINWDQTGIHYVPVSMAKESSK